MLRFADLHGYTVRRVTFEDPEDLSPLVADLYRWWNGERRLPANRLLGDSFILMEPWWTFRTGCVPYWSKFNTENSADKLEGYLAERELFNEIHLMLLSHGTESAGLASVDRWRRLLNHASRTGGLVGVDENAYPRDLVVFANYHSAVQRIRARYPVPGPLPLSKLNQFLRQSCGSYAVQWLDGRETDAQT